MSPCPSLNLSGLYRLYWVLKKYWNVTYDISLAKFGTRFVCGEYKISEIEKNWDFWEISRNISKKIETFWPWFRCLLFLPYQFQHIDSNSVLKNRTSKNGTPETLDHPLKLKYFEIFEKFFGENGINFLMDILRILKDFGYHNVAWKKVQFWNGGFLKWCNDDWLGQSYEVNLRSDYR